jgi:hypothetical protein
MLVLGSSAYNFNVGLRMHELLSNILLEFTSLIIKLVCS